MNQPTYQSKAEVWLHAADICDYSAMQAINGLGDDYRAVGKHLRLRRLQLLVLAHSAAATHSPGRLPPH